MLDRVLPELYGVKAIRPREQVKRNQDWYGNTHRREIRIGILRHEMAVDESIKVMQQKMKTTVFFLFGLILIVGKSSGQGNDTAIRKNYRISLERLLESNAMNDVKKIEFSIPVSKEEALIYFSSDYTKELSKSFQNLQQKIVKLGIDGNADVLTKYLYLSEFVDGYFAEAYFDDVEKIAKGQKDLLCRTLSKADKNKIKRLNEIIAKYCHQ